MRIRKRGPREVDDPRTQPSCSSTTTLQRKDYNNSVGIDHESEVLELAARGGGEAAALSLVLMAAEAVPHAVQKYKTRQNNYRADVRVLASGNQSHKVDSTLREENLDTSSNAKVASGQSASEKCKSLRTCTEDSYSLRGIGSNTISNSEGKSPETQIGEDKEISTGTVSDLEGLIHPCNQPEGSLTHSLCFIFSELPGNVGLSAREALLKIQEKGLPGLIEGDGVPRVQVAKIMRSNPCFVPVRGGKYLFTRSPDCMDFDRYETVPDSKDGIQKSREAKQQSEIGYSRVSSSSKDVVLSSDEKEHSRGLSPSSQVDNVGTRCTRVDGRSWQCRRTSLPGFSLCEHHHLQLSTQSRRQRNFQRAFNRSSQKRLRKVEKYDDPTGAAQEGNRTSTTESGRRKMVKARSMEAIVRGTVGIGSVNRSPSVR